MAESKDVLQRTALYDWHVEQGGRMVPFAGWEMPVQYPTGPLVEHQTTRQAAGLFDIDHMGQMEVRGPEAEIFVNHLVTYDVTKMGLFDAHYGLLCYEDGGCVDDLFIYKLPDTQSKDSECYFLIVINASNRAKDVAWVKSHTAGFDVSVKDISDETYMMAFQGPLAPAILNRLTKGDAESVKRFTASQDVILGDVPVLLGRTGYTGEDGFELFFSAEQAVRVWEAILKAGEPEGAKAIGLAARDSLRFEACMPLYGHELSPTITPVEAGLNFALSLDRDFIGRDALLKQKLESSGRALVGLELIDKGVAREGYQVQHGGQMVGALTSGMFAPTLKNFLGMAYVPRSLSARGTELEILIRDKATRAKIVKKPFYVPAYRR
ncbi:MAG TPA: glycine cleavage system aminomethyltransferase GcvT [Anaerolineales bacterium]|nr:glycine cleavage system aminomethyltransferase GcvT [Anaerolineales bacterium]